MIPPLVLPIILHLFLISPSRIFFRTSLPVLTSTIHQLTNLHHLPFHQKLILHWLQTLNFHPPLPPSKLAFLISFQRFQLRNFMHVGRKESGIMRRGIKRSMQKGKEEGMQKFSTRRLVDVNKTGLPKIDGGKGSKKRLRLG